ncbi:hypothetical protein HAX54_030703 [Datura stramonium]|uniref:Uncharacterized protein n=1 Tax=Datura stramonium TaxID=4076 RepID=A0ABS8SB82_DATST|nr:hypothetical protein [Datura stramonium]
MVEDGGGVAAVAGVSAITGEAAGDDGEETPGTGDDAGVMTGVSNPGLGVPGTGAATVDDGVVAGEFIGETNG